jgi:hypothetical protein
MLCKLGLLSLVVPLVSALTILTPTNPTTGGNVTIKWTTDASDPGTFSTFSFELINAAFNDAFAIANNVDPSLNQLTLTLPVVPVGDGYTLQAVNIGNISDVFASTGDFAVGASTASVISASSTSGSKTASSSGSAHLSSTTGISTPLSSTASTLPTSTSPASTSTGPTTTPSAFNGAITSRLNFNGPATAIAAVLISVVAVGMMAL